MKRHSLYLTIWYLVSAALAVSVILGVYSVGWEYSTRRYLKGFSDAIIPASAPDENKVQAILNWMAHGPARQTAGAPDASIPDRDPTETLNYDALLQVCGTATNAFVNLADSGGLKVRRVLLLDSNNLTKHVSAEVLVDGKWIVVDPAYRTILRGPGGGTVILHQLSDPTIFAAAIQRIPGYNPEYSYGQTVHLRMGRLSILGAPLFAILNRVAPGWTETSAISLLAERESLVSVLASFLLILFLFLLRVVLRWYGEKNLGVRPSRVPGSTHSRLERILAASGFARGRETRVREAPDELRAANELRVLYGFAVCSDTGRDFQRMYTPRVQFLSIDVPGIRTGSLN